MNIKLHKNGMIANNQDVIINSIRVSKYYFLSVISLIVKLINAWKRFPVPRD